MNEPEPLENENKNEKKYYCIFISGDTFEPHAYGTLICVSVIILVYTRRESYLGTRMKI